MSSRTSLTREEERDEDDFARALAEGMPPQEDPERVAMNVPENPAMALDMEGVFNHLNKAEMVAGLVALEGAGYETKTPTLQVITETVDKRSVLALADALVARAIQVRPEVFTENPDVAETSISPIALKSYFVILFLNRMRQVNEITGDAIGTIPYLSDDAPMPRPWFEMLCSLAPFKDTRLNGILEMEYQTEYSIVDECISGADYAENNLNTPALPSLQSLPTDLRGVHQLRKDATLEEVHVIETIPIGPFTLSDYWTQQVDTERIIQVVGQIWSRRFKYSELPAIAVNADFYASSREGPNAGPAEQLFNPFPKYDADHATVFTFFKRTALKATLNVRRSQIASTRPNESGPGAQYTKDYIFGAYVLCGELNDIDTPQYLGARKYYSLAGESYSPAPQFKLVNPEALKTHVVDVARSMMGNLSAAIAAQTETSPSSVTAALIYNSARFYRELCLAMLTRLYKGIQMHTFAFMSNPSQTALYNQSLFVQTAGSATLVAKAMGPTIQNGNLVLPFFEFGNLSLAQPWYTMDFDASPVITNTSVKRAYATTLSWSSAQAEDIEYRVKFLDQTVDTNWITQYELLPGHRKYPGFAVLCAQNYEKIIESLAPATGSLLSCGLPALGNAAMFTYSKVNRDVDQKIGLPGYDTNVQPNEVPLCSRYVLNVEQMFFSETPAGKTYSETAVSLCSFDIDEDNADLDNSFVEMTPMNQLPGSQSAWTLFNSDAANPNGVIQKAYAANVAAQHGHGFEVRAFGQVFERKVDVNMCWLEAVGTFLGGIADATFGGTIEAVGGIVDNVAGMVSDAYNVADAIFSTNQRSYYDGSPFLTQKHVNFLNNGKHSTHHLHSGRTTVMHKNVRRPRTQGKITTKKVPAVKGKAPTKSVRPKQKKVVQKKQAPKKNAQQRKPNPPKPSKRRRVPRS